MKLPTVEEFVKDSDVINAWTVHKYFKTYLTKGPRALPGIGVMNMVTVSNVTSKTRNRANNIFAIDNPKSTGRFRPFMRFIERLSSEAGFDGVYVESILNDFLPSVLTRYGYTKVSEVIPPSMYLLHNKIKKPQPLDKE